MKDLYGRTIDYMRISLTDRCNLRCKYCMPEGIPWIPMSEILTLEEIRRIAEAASALGIRHIRVTGGEPLVRKGCADLIGMLKNIRGIETVTITTNGLLLAEHLEQLVHAGVDGINISLDTTDRRRFAQLTGTDGLEQVMEGLHLAAKLDMPVKINAVSLDFEEMFGRLEDPEDAQQPMPEWQSLVELAREEPVDVRFIELMPIGHGKDAAPIYHERLYPLICGAYPNIEPDEDSHGPGPAVYYKVPGFRGSVGFISAVHGKFCATCNRVRLTAQGYLKTCLCYEDGVDLRSILRSGYPEHKKWGKLIEAMHSAIEKKPATHCFERPDQVPERKNMSMIGG